MVARAVERRVVHGDHAGARGKGFGPAERGDEVAGAHGEGLAVGRYLGGALGRDIGPALRGLGAGTAILQGVQGNEANLVQGVVIVVALAFIIINIVVDMLYLLINPRIRTV